VRKGSSGSLCIRLTAEKHISAFQQLEDFNNLRGIHSRQLPCVDAMANLLTLYQPLHTVFDYGGSCFIPVCFAQADTQLLSRSLTASETLASQLGNVYG
jgi:hypothetical protein